MRFKGLDLNLLVTFKVLLEEKSVSAAAEKLNLTQPAISSALKKLREYFKDDLLVVSGKQMLLTSHAMQIAPQLEELLNGIDIFVSKSTAFSPQTSTRVFTLAANDYFCSVVMAPLLSKLVHLAPGIKINIIPLRASIDEELDKGEVDLAFSPQDTLDKQHCSEALYREGLAILACLNNTRFHGNFTLADVIESSQVLVDLTGSQRWTMIQNKINELGLSLKSTITLPSFLVAPELIINTDLITIIHRRLALKFSQSLPLQTADLPSEIQSLTEFDYCVFSNPARIDDEGIAWLLAMIKQQVSVFQH